MVGWLAGWLAGLAGWAGGRADSRARCWDSSSSSAGGGYENHKNNLCSSFNVTSKQHSAYGASVASLGTSPKPQP